MDNLVLMDDVGYVLDDEQVFLFLVRQFVVGSYVKVDKLLLLELFEKSAVFPFLFAISYTGLLENPVLSLSQRLPDVHKKTACLFGQAAA